MSQCGFGKLEHVCQTGRIESLDSNGQALENIIIY